MGDTVESEDDPDPDIMEQYIPSFDDFVCEIVHILDYTFIKTNHDQLMKITNNLAKELILQAREYKTYHYDNIEHRMECGEKYRPLVSVYEKDARFILKSIFNDDNIDLMHTYLFSVAIVREVEKLLHKYSDLKLKPEMMDHIYKDKTTNCGQISWINKIKNQYNSNHHHHKWWWICH
jgi:hypothetical protein